MSSMVIAERLKVSPSYLKKIIKSLVDEGLLKSTPGKNGGFSLTKKIEDITFYDVFTAVEGRGRIFNSQRLIINFLGLDSDKGQKCSISDAMNTIENNLFSALSKITLARVKEETESNYDLSNLKKWINEND